MKRALLFFDGVTVSLPARLFDRSIDQEPILGVPLLERGLLVNVPPPTVLSGPLERLLIGAIEEALEYINRGDLLVSVTDWEPRWITLTMAHIGTDSLHQQQLLDEIVSTGLAGHPSKSGLFHIHPCLREIILYFYGQAFRAASQSSEYGFYVDPVVPSDSRWITPILSPSFHYPRRHSILPGQRIADELHKSQIGIFGQETRDLTVPFDVSSATLDDILEFKEDNGQHIRAYMKALREYATSLAVSTNPDALRRERDQEIEDYNASLRTAGKRNVVRASTSFAISALGAAWTMKTGEIGGAIFALMSAAAGLPRNDAKREVTSYSYLMKVAERFRPTI